ncbi:anaphase-promoting complex subunit 7 [Diorhabda carinulata]|uniref:anaphase-promoting complex subunit 7 n=1 Tax=Diorhabda carinulata TaxID=1163345 RepID=UPI0025A0BC21|nr:anaphase-promoting complex subunit 7 [Diorhabda carinulata]
MANTILNQLQALKDQELHSNICKVSDLALTLAEQKPDVFNLSTKLQITLYYSDACFLTRQYIQAESLYRQALQMRKNYIMKSKTSSNKIENPTNLMSDVDIKYQIHLCCVALKQKNAACEILQMISARHRTPKVNMALGNIYKDLGQERAAITCFKEVLRECPLALEAVENLLKLGLKGVEVNSLMIPVSSEISWLSMWIKAQAQLHSKDFIGALKTYKSMEVHGLLKDNISLLLNIAYCYHYLCEDAKAISTLQKILRLDPNMIIGRDLLSTLLAASGTKEHNRALEALIPSMDTSLWSAEHWVVLGNYMYTLKKYDKAAYFGQQACLLDKRNLEALLLKANTFLQIKKYQDASNHCTEALQLCNFRYDIHKCAVESYIQSNRIREAESVAVNACKQMNFSAQAYCLHASVLLKDPMAASRTVRKILEKAVSQDKTGATNALPMLVEFLEGEQQYEQASQLLLKHIETQKPSSRLHQLLGDCFVNLQKDDEAFHHYTTALKLDPTNQRSTEGLNNIGRSLSLSKRDSYYTCVAGETSYNSQGTNSSDHEVDPESDADPWPRGEDIESFDEC